MSTTNDDSTEGSQPGNPTGSLQAGMIYRYKSQTDGKGKLIKGRHWVVLEVTTEDILRGTCASEPGWYGFGGLWYGKHPDRLSSYGKIDDVMHAIEFYGPGIIEIVHESLDGLSFKEIKSLVEGVPSHNNEPSVSQRPKTLLTFLFRPDVILLLAVLAAVVICIMRIA